MARDDRTKVPMMGREEAIHSHSDATPRPINPPLSGYLNGVPIGCHVIRSYQLGSFPVDNDCVQICTAAPLQSQRTLAKNRTYLDSTRLDSTSSIFRCSRFILSFE